MVALLTSKRPPPAFPGERWVSAALAAAQRCQVADCCHLSFGCNFLPFPGDSSRVLTFSFYCLPFVFGDVGSFCGPDCPRALSRSLQSSAGITDVGHHAILVFLLINAHFCSVQKTRNAESLFFGCHD